VIQIDTLSPVPICEQIKTGLKGLIARGILQPGDQAPSVRNLAVELKVNPNTVAKAFRELVIEGILESRKGEGNYISNEGKKKATGGFDSLRTGLHEAIMHAHRGGLPWDDIEKVVRETKKETK